MPGRPMTTVGHILSINQIAVAQKDRATFLIRLDRNLKNCQHIRAIRVKGDFAKAFSLALGAVDSSGSVKPFERGIVLGAYAHSTR